MSDHFHKWSDIGNDYMIDITDVVLSLCMLNLVLFGKKGLFRDFCPH